MNVLVTGSAGYIGSVLVPKLRAAGHTVLGYDAEWFGPGDGPRIVGDIRDHIVSADWADAVVHLAGLSNDPMGNLDERLTTAINEYGTIWLLDNLWAPHQVIVSSCSVYGANDKMCGERVPVNPLTPYAFAKANVDEWARMWHADRSTSLRLGTVYGPSPNHRLDLVVNRMAYDAVTQDRVQVTGNAYRPLTHIEDVTDAIVWAVENQPQGIYNVVGQNARMADIGRLVADATHAELVESSADGDQRNYRASGKKIERAGWTPKLTVEDTLPDLLRFTRSRTGGFYPTGFPNGIRLHALTALRDSGRLDSQLRSVA